MPEWGGPRSGLRSTADSVGWAESRQGRRMRFGCFFFAMLSVLIFIAVVLGWI